MSSKNAHHEFETIQSNVSFMVYFEECYKMLKLLTQNPQIEHWGIIFFKYSVILNFVDLIEMVGTKKYL